MTIRPNSRMSIAIVLGLSIVVAELTAFSSIAYVAWCELFSPSSPVLKVPLLQLSAMFRGELAYPMCGMRLAPGMLQSGNVLWLRFVDLQTGRVRDLEIPPTASSPMGLVTDGKTLWIVGQQEIFETDGRNFVKHQPKRSLGHKASWPFVYEGCPALIECDSDGHHRLVSFDEGDWKDRGQIVLPGPNRAWVVDERTGNSVLVPRTSADSMVNVSRPHPIFVIPVRDQFHLFQSDPTSADPNGDCVFSYRIGFDFVAIPRDDEPVSAMVPANAPADTAGWVLLDSKLTSAFPCHATLNGNLLLGNEHEVWQHVRSEGTTISTKFERIAQMEMPENSAFAFSMISSPDGNEVYAVAGDLVKEIEVFRLDGRELQKMPYRIDGMGGPLKLWAAKVMFQGLFVLCVSTLVLVIVAAFWAGGSTYAFGHDTVVLAPFVRRCVARGLDLSLIFGPLVVHAGSLIWQTSLDSMFKSIDNLSGLSPLLPAVIWSGLMWIAIVFSTGLWGVTPGKWLVGLRVVRTTLRPCGLTRALLRELLLWLDAPQLLTILPGVLCHLVSQNRQRIGDLFAGTLVIVK